MGQVPVWNPVTIYRPESMLTLPQITSDRINNDCRLTLATDIIKNHGVLCILLAVLQLIQALVP